MKILVTGSNGFLGSTLTQALLDAGHSVIGLDRTLPASDWQITSPLYTFLQLDLDNAPLPDLAELKIDLVIHLAIAMQPGRQQMIEDLLFGSRSVLTAIATAKTPYLIGMSSMAVLDFENIPAHGVVDETAPRCEDVAAMGRYAALKASQEKLFEAFGHQQPSTRTVIIRPGLVYKASQISDAYAGIIKRQAGLVVANDGHIPVIEAGALIRGILHVITKLGTLTNNSVFHFVDDDLPSQAVYIERLQSLKAFPAITLRVHWRLLYMLVRCTYRIFKLAGLHGYLPDLFKPQAFATRLKPFRYSNLQAKQLLNWLPHRFN